MGSYLSSPVTEKVSRDGAGRTIRYGASEMQGWRVSMEDAYIAETSAPSYPDSAVVGVFDGHGGAEVARFCKAHFVPELSALPEYSTAKFEEALITTFHRMDVLVDDPARLDELRALANPPPEDTAPPPSNGPSASDVLYLSPMPSPNGHPLQQFLRLVSKLRDSGPSNPATPMSPPLAPPGSVFAAPAPPTPPPPPPSANNDAPANGVDGSAVAESSDAPTAASAPSPAALAMMDRQCELPPHPVVAGCTATVVVMHDGVLWTGNAGDSKAVLCRGGEAVPLSFEHKPGNPGERARIEAAGGFVSAAGRVNNNLNLSRSIGDLKYKQNKAIPPKDQIITAHPDVTRKQIVSNDEFVIVACDGVWDVMSNQDAVDFVRERITPDGCLSKICEELFDKCIASDPHVSSGVGADNMTCVIAQLVTKP